MTQKYILGVRPPGMTYPQRHIGFFETFEAAEQYCCDNKLAFQTLDDTQDVYMAIPVTIVQTPT